MGGIVIRGGPGLLSADPAELRAAAAAMRAAATALDEAGAQLGVAEHAVGAGELDSPVTARLARARLADLLHGPGALPALAERARVLAGALESAAALYGEADDAVAREVRAGLSIAGNALGGQPLPAAVTGLLVGQLAIVAGGLVLGGRMLRGEVPVRSTDLELLDRVPRDELVTVGGAVVRSLAPGAQLPDPAPVPGAARVLLVGTAAFSAVVPGLRRRPLQVTARLGETATGPVPASPADLLRDVGALYPDVGGAPGTVGVEKLVRPDGSRAWVVAIPGTQTLGLGSDSNPLDLSTDLRLMAGVVDDGTELVRRALAQAGALPGEPVLLAGHSQGGMVAQALAADPGFARTFPVVAVLTAGSPVLARPVPAGIPVLSLENGSDPVVALDGQPPPAVVNRTTAIRDLRASADPADRLAAYDPGGAHNIRTYVRTAQAVSATGAPSVLSWQRAADQVLGRPGTVAVRMEFTGARVNASGSPR